MAGGTFSGQTKVRPGAYANIIGVPATTQLQGNRGVVTFAQPMSWGPEAQIFEINAQDLYNGSIEALTGATLYDASNKLIRAALTNAVKLLLFRLNTGGTKAEVTLTNAKLKVTAKYTGTRGNTVSVEVKQIGDRTEIVTYLGSVAKYTQMVSALTQITDNALVSFTVEEDTVLTAQDVPTLLVGGADGTVEETAYNAYLTALGQFTTYNTIAGYDWTTDDSGVNGAHILDFIKELRENRGIKVQAVLNNYPGANYEGLISTQSQGVEFASGEKLDKREFVVWLAGATAGADIYDSNTYKIVENATKIINPLTDDGIETAILNGYLVLSTRRDGQIVIEKDINTLVTLGENKTDVFKHNKTIRLLDDVANQIAVNFENNYLGKINNDATGRNLFKSAVVAYLTNLQNSGGIINFNSTEDISVEAGEQADSIYVVIRIQPTYAVEKLYLVVNVQ